MDPTKLIYYDELYATELAVEVVDTGYDEKERPFLVLDKTLFHSHGGGQKGDRGKALVKTRSYPPETIPLDIIDTRGEKGGIIKHILGDAPPPEALSAIRQSEASLSLNWPFRYSQMRLHSSGHLLHVFMERFVGHPLPYPRIADILEDYGLNVYETVLDIKPDDMPEIVARLNTFLATGHEITTYPDSTNPVHRYWACDGVVIPCGGTHPRNTAEIGAVSASLSAKKGSTKVQFRLT